MSEIALAVMNMKGGVGKTTIALILTEIALIRRKRVLAIDLDPQRNFTEGLERVGKYFQGSLRIKDWLDKNEDSNASEDWIILDCPPAFGESSKSAIIFSDIVLVPVRPDLFSLMNLDKVYLLAKASGKAKNQFPVVKVGYDRTRISRAAEDILDDKDYPVIADLPLNRSIPFNIMKGKIWSNGLFASHRLPYQQMFERIERAFKRMHDTGNFEDAWLNSEIPLGENSKRFSPDRFVGPSL